MANPKPIAEVRIGRVKAAIWPNKTEGRTRHNVTFSRLYRDGDAWRRTQRASVATTCWCWRKWPIRPARASSSFSRKNSRRRSPSVRQASESGEADTRRSPNLHK